MAQSKRPSRNKKATKRRVNKVKAAAALAVLVISIFIVVLVMGGPAPGGVDPTMLMTEHVFINYVNVSFLNIEQARAAVYASEMQKLEEFKIDYLLDGQTYTITQHNVTLKSDLDDILVAALKIGREEDPELREQNAAELERVGINLNTTDRKSVLPTSMTER